MINQRHQDLRKGEDLYAQDVSHAIELLRAKWTIPIVCAMRERPVRLSDPTRLSKPEVIGDFGLHGSVRPVLTGGFADTVAQVSTSSKDVERSRGTCPAASCGTCTSAAAQVAANSAGVRSSSAE